MKHSFLTLRSKLSLSMISFCALMMVSACHASEPVSTNTLDVSYDVFANQQNQNTVNKSCVVLLHGLIRSSHSMKKMAKALQDDFVVINVDYPSRQADVETLAKEVVGLGVQACQAHGATPINFVTHSLGGILVRQFYQSNSAKDLNRVVMLAPPNQGSEIVDTYEGIPLFHWINGVVVKQLGTKEKSVPLSLGPVDFELAVIAGTKTINPILSIFLPNPDDGKVSVARAKVKGMCAFLSLPTSHPFIMKNTQSIKQTKSFLLNGKFADSVSDQAEYYSCSATKS